MRQRIINVFSSQGNPWLSTRDIARRIGNGTSPKQVYDIIYRTRLRGFIFDQRLINGHNEYRLMV